MKKTTTTLCLALAGIITLVAGGSVQAAGVAITGLVEAEFGFSNTDPGATGANATDESGVTLATVELHIDGEITSSITAHTSLLFEQGDTPLEVDEGLITWGDTDSWFLSMGQMYVPFGSFESNLISDPVTLELAETRETAALLGMSFGGLRGEFYMFNGDSTDGPDGSENDTMEHMGFSAGYGGDSFSVGVDYISSLGDSDSLQDLLHEDTIDVRRVSSYVPGLALSGSVTFGSFTFIMENISAMKSFQTTDFDVDDGFGGIKATDKRAKPMANNIELGMEIGSGVLGLALQNTSNAAELGLPELRFLAAYSMTLDEGVSLGFEFATQEDYPISKGGTGDVTTTMTAQLAAEF